MVKAKKVTPEKSKEGINYAMEVEKGTLRNTYIKEIINGRYFLSRSNMIAEQLTTGKILESIDGCPKSEDMMRSEYALMKRQAIDSMRAAHFAKKDLKSKYGYSDDDIYKIEEDYYDGKIIREEYEDPVDRKGKAGFVNE